MTIVTHEIDKINKSYKRLKYQKLIPCNCSICKDNQSPYFYDFQILRKFLADGQKAIQCQKSYEMVDVLGLIDDVESRQSGDNKKGDRKINIDQGDYVRGNKTNESRNINISGETINISGAGTLNLGDISGTVANTISNQPGIEELLSQLKEAIETSTDLDNEDKTDALEEVNNLAEASQDNDNEAKKNTAKQSLKMLRIIAKGLPPAAAFMTISKEVLPAIAKFFGL